MRVLYKKSTARARRLLLITKCRQEKTRGHVTLPLFVRRAGFPIRLDVPPKRRYLFNHISHTFVVDKIFFVFHFVLVKYNKLVAQRDTKTSFLCDMQRIEPNTSSNSTKKATGTAFVLDRKIFLLSFNVPVYRHIRQTGLGTALSFLRFFKRLRYVCMKRQ